MHSLFNFLVLLATRGLSLGCFFFLPYVAEAQTFQQYVIYFSVWQVASQLVAMQLGATMFRLGAEQKLERTFAKLISAFLQLAVVNALLFFCLIELHWHIAAAALMGVNFAVFSVIGDYCRSRINETTAFSFLMLPGLFLMLAYSVAAMGKIHFTFEQLAISEFLLHFAVILLLYFRYVPKADSSVTIGAAIANIAAPWRQISLPNWPSILIWYTYFNAPQILGYFISSQIDEYNRQAIVFRIIVAFSTLCAMLVVASQKRLVSIYERDPESYFREKRAFVYKLLPLSFAACAAAMGLTYVFKLNEGVRSQLPMVVELVWSFRADLAVLLWLLLNVYYISNFYLAEKNMRVIVPSMFAGFIMYGVALVAAYFAGIKGVELFTLPLSLSIATTLALRIVWLCLDRSSLSYMPGHESGNASKPS